MALLALTSASGAPGVTTAALAMTLLWPRPALLAECDVSGTSAILAGHLRGSVDASRGLVQLAVAQRNGHLNDEIWAQSVPLAENRGFVPALNDAAQAASMTSLWEPLSGALLSLERGGVDAIVDAGRLGAQHGPSALLRAADLVLVVARTSLPAVAAARARMGVLRETLAGGSAGPDGVGLLLIGEGRPYNAREVSRAVGVPVIASLAWDPVTADVFSVGSERSRRFESSPLVSSVRGAIAAAEQHIARSRELLRPAAMRGAGPSVAGEHTGGHRV